MSHEFANPRRGVNISAGTVIDRSGPCVISNANGMSFGMSLSTNNAAYTATAGLNVMRFWDSPGHRDVAVPFNPAVGFSVQRFSIGFPVAFSQVDVLRHLSVAASNSDTYRFMYGFYTFAQSTASLITSFQLDVSFTSGSGSSNSFSYGGHSGTRFRSASVPPSATSAAQSFVTLTPGEYLFAFGPGGIVNGTITLFGRSSISIVGPGAGSGNYSAYFGDGIMTVIASVMTDSFHLSAITQTGSAACGQPYFRLIG